MLWPQIKNSLCITLVTLFIISCSSKTKVESDLGIEDAPDWVNEGYQALSDDGGRLFHGVGSAPRLQNRSLQKTTADNRARTELANVFSSYMNVVSRDYSTSSGYSEQEMSQQSLARKIENITQLNLTGAVIIARWRDKKDGTIYSLAEINMKNVKQLIATANQMDSQFKDYFDQNSDLIFDKMAKE